MKSAREILVAARELISEPERWTKGESARDSNGVSVWIKSPEACRWCVSGAIERAANQFGDAYEEARCALSATFGGRSLGEFNDDRATTHPMIMAAFDKAIARVGE